VPCSEIFPVISAPHVLHIVLAGGGVTTILSDGVGVGCGVGCCVGAGAGCGAGVVCGGGVGAGFGVGFGVGACPGFVAGAGVGVVIGFGVAAGVGVGASGLVFVCLVCSSPCFSGVTAVVASSGVFFRISSVIGVTVISSKFAVSSFSSIISYV